MAEPPKITADRIVGLLERRHSKDIFVAESKVGPTWTARRGEGIRLDAWAMKRSWAHPTYWGYEIKVSRSDFLQDNKWRGYLDHCSDLSFVCPKGVIEIEEVPEGIGLIFVSKTGNKLYTKRKAAHREIEVPVELIMYLLISRTEVVPSYHYYAPTDADFWRDWDKEREIDRLFGRRVGGTIHKRIDEELEIERRRNDELESRVEQFGVIEEMIKAFGLDPRKASKWDMENRVRAALGRSDGELAGALNRAIGALEEVRGRLDD